MDIKNISTDTLSFALDVVFDSSLQESVLEELENRRKTNRYVEEYLTAVTELFSESNGVLNFDLHLALEQYTDKFVKNIKTL